MAGGDRSIDALLAAAGVEYARTLPGKVAELRSLVAEGAWENARRASHKLRGSAATYGHAALGASAGAIEEALILAGNAPGIEARARIVERLAVACAEAERAAREDR
jgi:HPt (histidine-containing phosphotransfer) domain-containing protein